MYTVEHIGIAVKSLAKSDPLFQKLLQVEPYKHEKVEDQGVITSFFKAGEAKIELLEAMDESSFIYKFIERRGEGVHHIAFEVPDIRAEMARLKKEGFQLLQEEPSIGADQKWVCFIHPRSANGVLIELCQAIPESLRSKPDALDAEHLAIAFSGAFLAGIINALAGNGSVITLTVLTELLSLPGNVANGTNRVGVLMNAAGAMTGFAGKREMNYRKYMPFILPVILGAIAGTIVATQVTHTQFMGVFKILMVVMLIVILVNPERWLIVKAQHSMLPRWLVYPIMLLLGFYGGFIQMGMGVFYLAVLVLVARLPMIESNTIKAVSVGSFTLIAVLIFALNDQVVWSIGLVMGGAQFLGGWLAAHYASKIPGAPKAAYFILVLAVSLSILKLFDVF